MDIIKENTEISSAQFDQNLGKPKEEWKLIKNILYDGCPPPEHAINLLVNDNIIHDELQVANTLNEHFISSVNALAQNIPNQSHISILGDGRINSDFAFTPATAEEIKMIINDMKSSSSVRVDGLSAKILKCCRNE